MGKFRPTPAVRTSTRSQRPHGDYAWGSLGGRRGVAAPRYASKHPGGSRQTARHGQLRGIRPNQQALTRGFTHEPKGARFTPRSHGRRRDWRGRFR